jgi:hypothetical protein
VYGENTADGDGVGGFSGSGTGVAGVSSTGTGVYARSDAGDGVAGFSQSGTGVYGEGDKHGVHGKSQSGRAVLGENTAGGDGVAGFSQTGTGVAAVSTSGAGLYARSGSGPAGHFAGHVEITGEIRLLGADCAEEFSVVEDVEPGTVMVIDDAGRLAVSRGAYDKRVAGVVAGAGSYTPALILDVAGTATTHAGRRPISLIGKTYCRADATIGAIGVGDLLTTAEQPGCAMVASDRDRAFGAVLGKALAPLSDGLGLIPILVALQ